MKEENILKNLKKEYEQTEPSLHLKLYGWRDITPRLAGNKSPKVKLVYRIAYMGAGVLISAILFFGVYQTAQAALPGSTLYPVKLLSENIINRISGNNQATIDNRAQEIVNLARQNQYNAEELKVVVSQYSQSIESAPVKDISFQKKLDEQNQEFNKVVKSAPEHSGDLQEAIRASREHGSNDNKDSSDKVEGAHDKED